MSRFSPRRLSRRLSTSLTFLVLFPIAGAVVGEFFIEFGKELGWYDKPSQRLEAVLTTFNAFFTQTWFLILAALLTGLTIGLWLDVALRKREARSALSISAANELLLTAEPGQLDHIIEGMQGIGQITKIFNELTKHTEKLVTDLTRYQRRASVTTDFEKRRKLAAALSLKLNAFSEQIRRYTPQVADASKRAHFNCLAVIENIPILDVNTLNSLLEFAKTLNTNVGSASKVALTMGETKNAVLGITGLTRDLNVSAKLISETAEALHVEIKAYATACESLFSAATARAETVLKVQSSPPEIPLIPTRSDTAEKTQL